MAIGQGRLMGDGARSLAALHSGERDGETSPFRSPKKEMPCRPSGSISAH